MGCGPPKGDARMLRRRNSAPELYLLSLTTLPNIGSLRSPQQQAAQQSLNDEPNEPPVKKPKIGISRIKRMFKARRKAGKIRKVEFFATPPPTPHPPNSDDNTLRVANSGR